MPTASLTLDQTAITAFCAKHGIRWLALFGSAARHELIPASDVDFLVEYNPTRRPGLVELQEIEDERSALCGGRRVDLVNPRFLNRHLKEQILAEAEVVFAEG